MNKGFSLIESAIVLLVLAAILAAIFAGRGLVYSSKINSIVINLEKYKIAYDAFKSKYAGIPGDIPDARWDLFENPAVGCDWVYAGNGNLKIENGPMILSDGGFFEIFTAMDMLSKAGFISYQVSQSSLNCTNILLGTFQVGSRYPTSHLKGAGYYFMYTTLGGSTGNKLMFGRNNPNASIPTLGALRPQELVNIDTKMDDGRPVSGRLSGALDSGAYGDDTLNWNGYHTKCYLEPGVFYGAPFPGVGAYIYNTIAGSHGVESCLISYEMDSDVQ